MSMITLLNFPVEQLNVIKVTEPFAGTRETFTEIDPPKSTHPLARTGVVSCVIWYSTDPPSEKYIFA